MDKFPFSPRLAAWRRQRRALNSFTPSSACRFQPFSFVSRPSRPQENIELTETTFRKSSARSPCPSPCEQARCQGRQGLRGCPPWRSIYVKGFGFGEEPTTQLNVRLSSLPTRSHERHPSTPHQRRDLREASLLGSSLRKQKAFALEKEAPVEGE